MGTYFDKKKLLEDNSDLYISTYDKNLDVGSLSQIIDAKRDYAGAQSAGDNEAMKKANDRANAVRKTAGRYVGGEDGSEYNRAYQDYEINRPGSYKQKYASETADAVAKVRSLPDFEYDAEKDPLYQNYKRIYMMLGDDAYERALSENALRTGGTVSSSAQSAAMQAKNKYNSMLTSKIPELYNLAYTKYRDGIADIYDQIDALSELEDSEYSKYRDRVEDFESDRDYFYGADRDYADSLRDMYKFDTDAEYDLLRDAIADKRYDEETAYKKERDAISDSQWEKEYNFEKEKEGTNQFLDQLRAAITLAKSMTGRYPVGSGSVDALLKKIMY